MPEECAVKVFKTTLNEFKTRDRYIKDDHRFKDRFSKQNPRKIIRLWAEKEMCNLSRLAFINVNIRHKMFQGLTTWPVFTDYLPLIFVGLLLRVGGWGSGLVCVVVS